MEDIFESSEAMEPDGANAELEEKLAAARKAQQDGDWSTAAGLWEQVRSLTPSDPAGFVCGAEALRNLGRFTEADDILATGIERFPADLCLAVDFADLAMQRRDWGEALTRWSSFRMRFPDQPAGFVGAARAFRELGQLALAEVLVEEAARRFPDHPDVHRESDLLAASIPPGPRALDHTEAAEPLLIQWSAAKINTLERLAGSSDDGLGSFLAQLARVQLAAAAGERGRAETILTAVLRACGGASAHEDVFIELVTAAFALQRCDLVAPLLFERYQFACPLEITLGLHGPGPHLVRWEVDLPRRMGFTLDQSILQVDSTREQVLWFLWLCPLFAHFSRAAPAAKGETLVNQSDSGISPGLAMCEWRPDFFLIPDNVFIPTRGYEHIRRDFAVRDVAWDERRPIAFWRGATTGQLRDPAIGWWSLPRVALCLIARSRPDLFDVGLSGVVQISDPVAGEQLRAADLIRPYVPVRDFDRVKYHIDIDGNTNSWPGLFQKLLTGSPVIKVASPRGFRQWYYDDLKPWRNYVPVSSDMGDLIEKVEWLRDHDHIARQIGEGGRALAASLTYEREMNRAVSVIRGALSAAVHSAAPVTAED
jgi:tetratricopeptide (TPR) repeat protein